MENATSLLDTPKKTALRNESTELRAALKEFERSFTQRNGSKPKQTDIKNDPAIAAKYKQYHKVQDVLAGKLAFEKLNEVKAPKRSKTRTHSRQDSGIGSVPPERSWNEQTTPKKRRLPQDLETQNTTSSASPEQAFLSAIGPTPHRDGKVLGLFDLLQRSGSEKSSAPTPNSSARKRKLDALFEDTPAKRPALKVIQTPSRQPARTRGDLLDYLEGTPQKSSNPADKRHSRTPQSDGRKFQLSQFFATPSTNRFLFAQKDIESKEKTPLRDLVLGQTPEKQPDTIGMDATPDYLRRSTSFKDRLLSASQPTTAVHAARTRSDPLLQRTGPPTLRHFRSSTSNIFKAADSQTEPQRASHMPSNHYREEEEEEADHDDDLDALHELEGHGQPQSQPVQNRVLVPDSQLELSLINPLSPSRYESRTAVEGEQYPPLRQYKKKGQKRTTKKSNIKPVMHSKPSAQPKFVAANDSDDDDDDEKPKEEPNYISDEEFYDGHHHDVDENGIAERKHEKSKKQKTNEKDPKSQGKAKKKAAGTINPNAQSHTNFRSLKIKNKNSRAKGAGRARFGRGRR